MMYRLYKRMYEILISNGMIIWKSNRTINLLNWRRKLKIRVFNRVKLTRCIEEKTIQDVHLRNRSRGKLWIHLKEKLRILFFSLHSFFIVHTLWIRNWLLFLFVSFFKLGSWSVFYSGLFWAIRDSDTRNKRHGKKNVTHDCCLVTSTKRM